MTTQLSMFEITTRTHDGRRLGVDVLPATNYTPTSNAAAERIAPHINEQHRRILAAVRSAPDGLTRDEIEDVTGLAGNSVRPRVAELIHREKLLVEDGTRENERGNKCAVVKAVQP